MGDEPNTVVDRIAEAVGWTGAVAPKYDWDHVEKRLKTPFPADYQAFMARFPSCFFRDSLRLWNPIQNTAGLRRFTEDFTRHLANVNEGREYYPEIPAAFPQPGGVIPFADDAAGGVLFWSPRTADPDGWHVVYQSSSLPDVWRSTRRSMTAVLLEFATSRSTRNLLRWDMSGKDRSIELF
ncbi:SMI1/KNR4 family protein [Amycolatopsis sp. OK19-0408]|uniref:SMI1/KNR4 family protein n=1 Tax=Amycolatopsis iheyensis TaxID=2945988 RepID=A0A9X2SK37_9PSEU|nr:SMI1/KNR4 family protein [Amycolatopsis iheyensis]MCR6482980.1 SMI1/KNR4 family protein [Amycolatopsis iheyensis]